MLVFEERGKLEYTEKTLIQPTEHILLDYQSLAQSFSLKLPAPGFKPRIFMKNHHQGRCQPIMARARAYNFFHPIDFYDAVFRDRYYLWV